jgi:hypothetical protein
LYKRYRRLGLAVSEIPADVSTPRRAPSEESISAQVVKAAQTLGEGDFERGLRLVQKAMPQLWRDYCLDYAR